MDFSYAPTDINELMEDICLQMQQKNQRPEVQIMFTEKEPGCVINTDRLRLSQVIMNLMNNAMKFTSEGSITLGYRLTRQKDELYFFVKDTGIGIPCRSGGKGFRAFCQTEYFCQRYRTGTCHLPGDYRTVGRNDRSGDSGRKGIPASGSVFLSERICCSKALSVEFDSPLS